MAKTGPSYKVVHLATYINGGAGTSARRIHQALLQNNIFSSFLSTDAAGNTMVEQAATFTKPKPGITKRIFRKIRRKLAVINLGSFNRHYYFNSQLEAMLPQMKYEVASLPFSEWNVLQHPLVKEADIIHLHWVAGLLDYPSFFALNKKPVVITLHDMNAIKGLYHYEEDEQKNKKISGKLDKEVFEIKRSALAKATSKLTAVAPSAWLQTAVKKAGMFPGNSCALIPYAVEPAVFFRRDPTALRHQLQIPADHTVLLFVSQSIRNHRKGFDLLIEALQQTGNRQITLLTIGLLEGNDLPGFHRIDLGSIYNEEDLAKYYSLADAFVLPSREDNLPNVMLESLCCGTPVICFDTGGISASIQNGFNGLKASAINGEALAAAIEKFIATKNDFDPAAIREAALKLYSPEIIAAHYDEIYSRLLYET